MAVNHCLIVAIAIRDDAQLLRRERDSHRPATFSDLRVLDPASVV